MERKIIIRKDSTRLEYLTFPALDQTGIVKHLFTTRLGGVSKGIYSSMNLSFSRGDNADDVTENYRRIAQVLQCELEDFVCSDQTHTTNIRRVTKLDKGKGILIKKDYHDIDGLVTNESGVVLVTYYADCVPLYFVDSKHKAIGLAHSGWRGTVDRMGACMCRRMKQEFGSEPEDLQVAIGPSICRDCYEVSEDVAFQFQEKFSEAEKILTPGKAEGKYQLDLWLANVIILQECGIPLSHISISNICTCHNPDYLYSHRASKGKRGSLAAFMKLL